MNLGEKVNSIGDDFSPVVSPDGEYFFWTSCRSFIDVTPPNPISYSELLGRLRGTRNGSGDLYMIDLSAAMPAAAAAHPGRTQQDEPKKAKSGKKK